MRSSGKDLPTGGIANRGTGRRLPADCGRNQTEGTHAMDSKPSDSTVATISIDIGKNALAHP
jgi:hypothetical protein